MKIGQQIVCKDNSAFEVLSELGSGGQGSLYHVCTADKERKPYVLKIINEKNPTLRQRKIANIRKLKGDRPLLMRSLAGKNFRVALPISLYEEGDAFGYIMEVCPGKDINHLMLEHAFDKMRPTARIRMVGLIAESANWMQLNGYCYQDFSHKNFMYDPDDEKCISVIDCDNLAPSSAVKSGLAAFAGGTGFYMAPEVAFKQCKPSIESDNFALATLFFKIMTGSTDSPYHGRELYSKRPRPATMLDGAIYTLDDPEDYGYDWLTFIFDPDNEVNRPCPAMFKNPSSKASCELMIKNWSKVPLHMRELFYRAFRNPLSEKDRVYRPTAAHWYRATLEQPPKRRSTVTEKGVPSVKRVKPVSPSVKEGTVRVVLPDGSTVSVIDRVAVNTVDGRLFGVIEKKEEKYYFTAFLVYALQYTANKKSEVMVRGDRRQLFDRTEICILMNPKEKLIVYFPQAG